MFNLADSLIALARRFPDRPAVLAPGYELTFAKLLRRSGALTRLLAREGIGLNDKVGVTLTSNADALLAMIALWFLGATPMVADFRSRADERRKLVAAVGLKAYLEDRPAPGAGDYPAIGLAADWAEGSGSEPMPDAARFGNPVAAIGVSSGTSGLPQPVALSHDCLFARYCMCRTSAQWQPGGRLIVTAPLAFSATRKHVLSRLLDGDSVVFTSLLVGPQDLAARIFETGATAMLTVPAIARGLFDLAPADKPLFPDLSYLMCCGAPMTPQEKIDSLRRLSSGFVQNYGSTMAGMITVLASADVEAHASTVGRPLDQALTQIVDSDNRPLPPGETGIVRVRTPAVAAPLSLGESDGEKRTSDLVIDGWIYPGDIGFLDPAGFLTLVGRATDLIIRGGVNVYPTEIEAVLASHPAVAEAAVVGWPDHVLGEEIAAFVVLRREIDVRELRALCNGRLQPDKQPREIFVIPEMPRNANGKLVRRDLQARLPDRSARV